MKLNGWIILCSLFSCLFFSCGNKDAASSGVKYEPIQTPEQLQLLNKKILEDPNNHELYFLRAKYHMETKDFESALNDMIRVIKVDSLKPEYLLTMADISFFMNRTGVAKMYFEKTLELDAKNTEAMLKLAQLYMYVNKHDKSIEYANMILKQDQYHPKAYFVKGMNYKAMGDTATALSSMQTAVEQDNNYYDAYMQLGVLNGARKNPLAVDYYNNALRINPKSREAMYDKAKFFQDMGENDKAIATYNQLLQADPGYLNALFNLGVIYLENKKDYDKAFTYFDNATEVNRQYAEAYCGRGRANELKNKINEAMNDYRTCLGLKPGFSPAVEYLNRLENKK